MKTLPFHLNNMKRDSGVIKANRYQEWHKRQPPVVLRYWDVFPVADLIPHKCFYQLFCYSPMLSTVAANVNVTGSVIINFLQKLPHNCGHPHVYNSLVFSL